MEQVGQQPAKTKMFMPVTGQDTAKKSASTTAYAQTGQAARDSQRKRIYDSLTEALEGNSGTHATGEWTTNLEEALYLSVNSVVNREYREKAALLVKNIKGSKKNTLPEIMKNKEVPLKELLAVQKEARTSTAKPVVPPLVRPPVVRPVVPVVVPKAPITEKTTIKPNDEQKDLGNKEEEGEGKKAGPEDEEKDTVKETEVEGKKACPEDEQKDIAKGEEVENKKADPEDEQKYITKGEEVENKEADPEDEQKVTVKEEEVEGKKAKPEEVVADNTESLKETSNRNEVTTEKIDGTAAADKTPTPVEEPLPAIEKEVVAPPVPLLELPKEAKKDEVPSKLPAEPVKEFTPLKDSNLTKEKVKLVSEAEDMRLLSDLKRGENRRSNGKPGYSISGKSDWASLQNAYREIRRDLEMKKRKLYTTNNELNYCIIGGNNNKIGMTKGQLLEEECKKNKKLAEEASRALAEAQAKTYSTSSAAEELLAEKERHENLLNELQEIKKMYVKCKDAKKAQASAYKRDISEYKFELEKLRLEILAHYQQRSAPKIEAKGNEKLSAVKEEVNKLKREVQDIKNQLRHEKEGLEDTARELVKSKEEKVRLEKDRSELAELNSQLQDELLKKKAKYDEETQAWMKKLQDLENEEVVMKQKTEDKLNKSPKEPSPAPTPERTMKKIVPVAAPKEEIEWNNTPDDLESIFNEVEHKQAPVPPISNGVKHAFAAMPQKAPTKLPLGNGIFIPKPKP